MKNAVTPPRATRLTDALPGIPSPISVSSVTRPGSLGRRHHGAPLCSVLKHPNDFLLDHIQTLAKRTLIEGRRAQHGSTSLQQQIVQAVDHRDRCEARLQVRLEQLLDRALKAPPVVEAGLLIPGVGQTRDVLTVLD